MNDYYEKTVVSITDDHNENRSITFLITHLNKHNLHGTIKM